MTKHTKACEADAAIPDATSGTTHALDLAAATPERRARLLKMSSRCSTRECSSRP